MLSMVCYMYFFQNSQGVTQLSAVDHSIDNNYCIIKHNVIFFYIESMVTLSFKSLLFTATQYCLFLFSQTKT